MSKNFQGLAIKKEEGDYFYYDHKGECRVNRTYLKNYPPEERYIELPIEELADELTQELVKKETGTLKV